MSRSTYSGTEAHHPSTPRFTLLSPATSERRDPPVFNDDKENMGHRLIRLSMEEETEDELNNSLIACSRFDTTTKQLLMMVEKEGIQGIKIQGLAKTKFLLTFNSFETKNEFELGWLDHWFSSFHEVSHKDLILPRKTWIKCDRLPLSLWNKSN